MQEPTPHGPVERYRRAARVLHWLVAAMLVFVWGMGAVIGFVTEEVKLTFYMIHESFGFLILLTMLARSAVRWFNPPPAPVPMPLWERRLADVVHAALYVMLVVQPVMGLLATNAHGFPFALFGVVPIPSPVGEAPGIAPVFSAVHFVGAWVILLLVVLHVGGALRHHALRRDPTIYRMI